jgi:hypothetical protein
MAQEKSIFSTIKLLWINIIMNNFAALAHATDPTSESLFDTSILLFLHPLHKSRLLNAEHAIKVI